MRALISSAGTKKQLFTYARDCPARLCGLIARASRAVMMWLSFPPPCMVRGRSASFRPTSHLHSPTTSTASTTTSSQPPAFFRSHPHRHHHHDNTIYCKSTLLFCLKILLKAVLSSHCCCRLDNSPCFGVESRYSPPVPEPTF